MKIIQLWLEECETHWLCSPLLCLSLWARKLSSGSYVLVVKIKMKMQSSQIALKVSYVIYEMLGKSLVLSGH